MNMLDGVFVLVCFAVVFHIIWKFSEWWMKNKHEDYLKNVTDRFIKDCVLNCPEGTGYLVSSYLHKNFGKIIGWMPGSLLSKKDNVINTGEEDADKKPEFKKSNYKIHNLYFYAIIPGHVNMRFRFLTALFNFWKTARLVAIPMSLVKQKALTGDVSVDVYSLVTREGDILVPSNTNIPDSDFSGFVKTEYLLEAQSDILRKVGKLVDRHSEMVGSEEMMQGMFRSQRIPQGGKE